MTWANPAPATRASASPALGMLWPKRVGSLSSSPRCGCVALHCTFTSTCLPEKKAAVPAGELAPGSQRAWSGAPAGSIFQPIFYCASSTLPARASRVSPLSKLGIVWCAVAGAMPSRWVSAARATRFGKPPSFGSSEICGGGCRTHSHGAPAAALAGRQCRSLRRRQTVAGRCRFLACCCRPLCAR